MADENEMKEQAPKRAKPARVEQKEAKPVKAPALKPENVAFNVWYAMRKSRIPEHHHKEILAADFRNRGLGEYATVEAYDKALKAYGIR